MVQLEVENSPFNQEQVELLNRLIPTLTDVQLVWLSGYLTALNKQASPVTAVAKQHVNGTAVLEQRQHSILPAGLTTGTVSHGAPLEVTVLFGTDTGNSKRLAERLTAKLKEHGIKAICSSMDQFKPQELKKVRILLIVVSTHGEGDPPDNALSFYEFLHSRKAPRLEGVQFSVLALGDSSYEHFCQAGKDLDKRLEELGGARLFPRIDCDVDFDDAANEWMEGVLEALVGQSNEVSHTAEVAVTAETPVLTIPAGQGAMGGISDWSPSGTALAEPSPYSRTHPFQAEVLANINLNGRGSDQETRHVELSLAGSNLVYEPGDCLGIYPENHPVLVDKLIEAMGWKPEEPVPVGKAKEERPLRDALLTHYEITVLTKPLLEKVAALVSKDELQTLLAPENNDKLREYLNGRDMLDLVRDFSLAGLPARDFVPLLRKMPARLYSISSSLKASPEEASLTIRAVRYHAHGRDRYGVCSVQVAERVQPGDTLPVYVHHNPEFKLPADPDVPLIMIGPGTGVAPFRSFLAEREVTGAKGKTWLFFGDRHFLTDFLYQLDWQRWLKEGVLTRMDVAFSRDTNQKVYVQHRMLEKSRELFAWLEEGAYLYVCGDEKRMAKDVHATLLKIIQQEGGLTQDQSEEYLAQMRREKRYQRDVY